MDELLIVIFAYMGFVIAICFLSIARIALAGKIIAPRRVPKDKLGSWAVALAPGGPIYPTILPWQLLTHDKREIEARYTEVRTNVITWISSEQRSKPSVGIWRRGSRSSRKRARPDLSRPRSTRSTPRLFA